LASSQTYKKLSSNGLDLVELEPKSVDHRQIPIDPVAYLDHHDVIMKVRDEDESKKYFRDRKMN
jgi:hypothetical protein